MFTLRERSESKCLWGTMDIFMLTRPEKEKLLEELKKEFREDSFIVFTDYRGLKAKDITTLRRTLRKAGVRFQVVKKTLLRMAAKEEGIEEFSSLFEGQIGIVFSPVSDVTTAKTLHDFSKQNPALKILGGILEKRLVGATGIQDLASLPTLEELRARAVGAVAGALYGLRNVLASPTRTFVYQLNTLSQQK